jgi:hypothetical protein
MRKQGSSSIARKLIQFIGLLVPRRLRADWRQDFS